MMKKKWADKEKGLRFYGDGTDLYGHPFSVEDGSWAEFQGIRIYLHDSIIEKEVCFCLRKDGVEDLIKALKNVRWE